MEARRICGVSVEMKKLPSNIKSKSAFGELQRDCDSNFSQIDITQLIAPETIREADQGAERKIMLIIIKTGSGLRSQDELCLVPTSVFYQQTWIQVNKIFVVD